ncbi:hypothetical protein [Methanosphaerula palustris]|uniref:Cohesin domain-containing protein n=1 Tax=Methanosphaerula palustris (strain ATCC BAA-1556 / DSM 19958 / E1-9c) TaxID=521011 RepID=B8GGY2_METPE|nr:hypothetical protein [Methanosphaerula palustris]ACL16387.1 hypothetical protein Mpal_1039 [Methanosphaerula palustris E1-9c]
MKLYRSLLIIGLVMISCITMASAGGMAMFKVAAPEHVNTGDVVTATIAVDNNLNPLASDMDLVLDWDGTMLQYMKTDFQVGHTTSTEQYGKGTLELMLADSTNGFKNGEYDMAVVTFVAIGPGETTPKVRVHSMNDLEGNDISGKTDVKATTITIAGDALNGTIPTLTQTTVLPVTTTPTVQQNVTLAPVTQTVQTWPATTQQQSWPLPGQQVTVAAQQGLQQGASSGSPAAATTIPTLFPGTVATVWPPVTNTSNQTVYQTVQTYQSVYQNSSSGIQNNGNMSFQSFVADSGQSQNYNPNGSGSASSTNFNSLIETSQTTIPPTQNNLGIQKDSSFKANNTSITTTTTAKKSGSMFGLLSVAALAGVALIAARQRKNE